MLEENNTIREIREMLGKGQASEAVVLCNQLIDNLVEVEENNKQLALLYYLRGSGYHRMGDVRKAMNSYLESIGRDPEGPAKLAYNNIIEILDFYNHDLYNP